MTPPQTPAQPQPDLTDHDRIVEMSTQMKDIHTLVMGMDSKPGLVIDVNTLKTKVNGILWFSAAAFVAIVGAAAVNVVPKVLAR